MADITEADDTLNTDWIKTLGWDVRNPDQTEVTTYDELVAFCERQGMTVEDFLALPAAQAMPDTIVIPGTETES